MARLAAKIRAFRCSGGVYLAPKDWTRERLANWIARKEDISVETDDLELMSLTDKIKVEQQTMQMVDAIDQSDYEVDELPVFFA